MLLFWLFVATLHSSIAFPHDEIVDIIGGRPVNISKVPYMASVRIGKEYHWCGGSIINERFILSAAHCFIKKRPYYVAVGITKLNETGDTYKVDQVLLHQNYSDTTLDYDIALLRVSKPIVFKNNVQKIKLPTRQIHLNIRDKLSVSGWGKTEISEISNDLLTVKVPFVHKKSCQNQYKPIHKKITNRMLCAGKTGKDSCQGDSGGPLVLANGVQVGITSSGNGCGIFPGVYTKVSAFKNWIAETMENN